MLSAWCLKQRVGADIHVGSSALKAKCWSQRLNLSVLGEGEEY